MQTMNCDRIGQAAGALWNRLSAKGTAGISLTDLKKVPGVTSEEALAGLGWLAREGKLSFRTEGRKIVVALTEEPAVV
jgi:hypothetical protein